MEFKRLFTQMGFVSFIIIIYLTCVVGYTVMQCRSNDLNRIIDQKNILNNILQRYSKQDNKVALDNVLIDYKNVKDTIIFNKKYDQNANKIYRLEMEEDLLDETSQILNSYCENDKKISKIQQQALIMNEIDIFNNSTFSKNNILKTSKDFENLKGLNLKPGSDKVITSIFKYGIINYIILFFLIIIVFQFVKERKKGLWTLIHATPNGRAALAWTRIKVLFLSIFSFIICTYATIFTISYFLYGGHLNISRPIQSIILFQNITIPMSILEFILIFLSLKIFSFLLVSLFIWFIISKIQNRTFSLLLLSIIFIVEFLLYRLINDQSNFSLFKYINIFQYIHPERNFESYLNVKVFNLAINRFNVIFFCMIFFLILLSLCCILTANRKKPISMKNRILNIFEKISDLVWRYLKKLNVFKMELYKSLIIHKGLIALLILVTIISCLANYRTMSYDSKDRFLNEFYKEMNGVPNQKTNTFMKNLKTEIDGIEKEFEDASAKYETDALSDEEYYAIMMKMETYMPKIEGYNEITEKLNEIKKTREDTGIQTWLLNQRGYKYLLSSSSYEKNLFYATLIIFYLIIILPGIFGNEKTTKTINIIRCSKRGRAFLYFKKLQTVFFISFITSLISYAIEIYKIYSTFGLSCLSAPVQSLDFVSNLQFKMNIATYIVIIYLIRLFIIFIISLFICSLSIYISVNATMFISSLLLIIPTLLYMIGFSLIKFMCITIPMACINDYFNSNNFAGLLLFLFIILLIGLICGKAGFSKWYYTTRKVKENKFSKGYSL